ncbi:Endonuclease/exonuclease/phosphatase family protein [Priestia megaterium]|uniref:endonuclease/exonuclease/phosphatase family protein n=1 Tax=Priestia megaterium TaxID=1404 RepID=UPI0039E1884E
MKIKIMIKSMLIILSALIILAIVFNLKDNSKKNNKSFNYELKVMTYNLRYLNDIDKSPHTWKERCPTIRQVIKKANPDIIGTQEVVYKQIKCLNKLGDYDWVGLGREGGSKGEYMAVFYNKKRFKVLEYNYYWLSDNPNLMGSISWGNIIPRMVTSIKFHDVKTDKEFYFLNTQFDNQSELAREKSALLILERLKVLNQNTPVILTGDFNTSPNTSPYQLLTSDLGFIDAWESSKIRINKNIGTFNNFQDPRGGGLEKRIDWILYRGKVQASQIKIINYHKGKQYPSDHYPVMVNFLLRNS